MNAFESLVASMLSAEGYWVTQGFKVNLTKEEKREIGRPTTPRWEIDLLAYKGSKNSVVAVECKSYLDSPGVHFVDVNPSTRNGVGRYKLFTDSTLRQVVFSRLSAQLSESGLCRANPKIQLGLATGKIASPTDRQRICEEFAKYDFLLWDDLWIKEKLGSMASSGYSDDPSIMAAKVLLKEKR